jgi:hypothetical protein
MNETIFVVVPAPKKGDGKTIADEEPRTCPIHRDDNPNGGETMLRPGDPPFEVKNSTGIRRRIRSGDLREATKDEITAAAKAAEKLAADNEAAAKKSAPATTK